MQTCPLEKSESDERTMWSAAAHAHHPRLNTRVFLAFSCSFSICTPHNCHVLECRLPMKALICIPCLQTLPHCPDRMGSIHSPGQILSWSAMLGRSFPHCLPFQLPSLIQAKSMELFSFTKHARLIYTCAPPEISFPSHGQYSQT